MLQLKSWFCTCLILLTVPQIAIAEEVMMNQKRTARLDMDWRAHYAQARRLIAAMMNNLPGMAPVKARAAPPGSPIGSH